MLSHRHVQSSWPEVLLLSLMHTAVIALCDRCERASAYLRGKGAAYSDVVQLSGGIERYLQAFPDSGYFTGKNFVFDERVAVAAAAAAPAAAVVGRCAVCAVQWDSYAPRCRCVHCRVLMLVCSDCLPTVTGSSTAATMSNTTTDASCGTDEYESESGDAVSSATAAFTDATSTYGSDSNAAAAAVARDSGGLLQLVCTECRQRTAVQCTKRATHGFRGRLPLLCRKHFEHSSASSSSSSFSSAAAEGMIDLTVEGCCEGGLKGGHCAKLPRFGMPIGNTAPRSCGPHKREGYVNLMEGLCQYGQSLQC
jgi:Rhodanase C-terminal/EsV-1-7 cysteine-rich motif